MSASDQSNLSKEIFLVDDSSVNIDIMRDILSVEKNWKIHEALCGLAAWEMLDQWLVPDLCIIDIHMKPGTGFELAERMRKDRRFAASKIFFLSGDSLRETVVKAMSYTPVGYMVKPLDKAQILQKVRQVLVP
jgi:putative two-component system response regulator